MTLTLVATLFSINKWESHLYCDGVTPAPIYAMWACAEKWSHEQTTPECGEELNAD